jgi:hypothetical protein
LVAAGLGVPEKVFREAFSYVTPAPAGSQPEPEQVQRNKRALLDRLSSYGVTNERLDTVSDYYRYNRSRGEIWRSRPARIEAEIVDGKVSKVVVVDGGAGYTTPPRLTLPGYAVQMFSKLRFSTDLRKNGSVESVLLLGVDD